MYTFEEKIERLLADENIAGCAAAVTDRDGIVWSRGFGVESIERPNIPVNEESMFRVASITKVVTGILIMRLSENGLIDLDRPVRDYIPWFTLKDKSAVPLITTRHLLSHRAGFPAEYTPIGPREESALESCLIENIPTLDLAYPPDEGYIYSNWGTRLASYIAERVAGRRYSELARDLVLSPLGMDRSTFDLNVAATYPLSLPHERDESGRVFLSHFIKENYARLAAGGLYSNVREVSVLARLILRGGIADDGTRIISSASFDQMKTRITTHESGDGYGIAMQMHRLPYGGEAIGHYGGADPYTSAMMIDQHSGYGAVVMLNTYSEDLRVKISDMLLEAFSQR